MKANVQQSQKEEISWENFQKDYLSKADEFRYEWLNGSIEKTKRTLNYHWFYIYRNLQNAFFKTNDKSGVFLQNVNILFQNNHRKLDFAYFKNEQIAKMAHSKNQTPIFIIEIISKHDLINTFNQKMLDYRKANVETVWRIHPETKEVHIYSGKNLKEVAVCFDKDICKMGIVEMLVEDIFELKTN